MSRRKLPPRNDHIHSDDDLSDADGTMLELATGAKKRQKTQNTSSNNDGSTNNETVDESRLRLVTGYIESLDISIDSDEEKEVDGTDDDERDDYQNDPIAAQLRQQALRVQGREQRTSIVDTMNFSFMTEVTPVLHNATASKVPLFQNAPKWVSTKHRYHITSLALSDDNEIAITGSNGGSIHKHDIETGAVTKISPGRARNQPNERGHTGAVFGTAISSDNIYLATAGKDETVRIWDLRSNTSVGQFPKAAAAETEAEKEAEAFTCVKFQKNTLNLFFSGHDRKIHAYDCQTMKYMNSFFGPTAPTMAMDCLYQNKVFIGGGDCVPMILKPEAETIMSFQSKDSRDLLSVDALAAIDHDNFITGTQTNILQLWSSSKKTPHNSVPNAHAGRTIAHLGTQRYGLTMQTTSHPIENWIISLAALYASDLVVSGSSDGYIRAWRAHLTEKQLHPVFNIPVQGFVNGLQIGQKGRFLLAAVGKNHRLGTWQGHITNGVKEGLYFYDLSPLYDGDNGAGNGFVHQFADNDLGSESGDDDNE